MKKRPLLLLGIALVLGVVWVAYKRSQDPELQYITGQTMGTITYNVKYIGTDLGLQEAIDEELVAFNQSLSTYIPDSEISKLNTTGSLSFESGYFYPVLTSSQEIFERTDGAYDPTVGPLVDAWGFGPDGQIPDMDSSSVDSLRRLVGFGRIKFSTEFVEMPEGYRLDFSAIAKGYAVDLVAELLEEERIDNYLVEIGGEVRCKGVNEKGESWSLGIEDPLVDIDERRILAIVRLRDRALATSGNYRNYYEKDGRTYAHIIDPRTGYNTQHRLLSASVFASNCMTADAYATALMVLGVEPSKQLLASVNGIDAMLVYLDEEGVVSSYVTEGIKPYLELNRAQ